MMLVASSIDLRQFAGFISFSPVMVLNIHLTGFFEPVTSNTSLMQDPGKAEICGEVFYVTATVGNCLRPLFCLKDIQGICGISLG